LKLPNQIILASESPRRRDLLMQLGIKKIQILKHNVDEINFEFKLPITKSVKKLAEMKALSITQNSKIKKKVIISGDTLVYRAGKIFHKSNSKSEVKNYLKLLSDRKHFVYGAICVISKKNQIFSKVIKTEVYFNKITESDLTNDILEDGLGKAGGYAIQKYGARFVKKIRGCYTNIVGISIPELYKILKSSEF
jgi:septum formation protein